MTNPGRLPVLCLLLLAVAGGLAVLGWPREARVPETPVVEALPAERPLPEDGPLGTPRGYYFEHVHDPAFERHEVSCLMISPHVAEPVPEWTPPGFTLRASEGRRIDAFVRALGKPPPAFADEWRRVRRAVGASEGPTLRVFVRFWARPRLPGRCVTVAVTFYNVPDPYIGAADPGPWPGLLFDVRKTYQLAGGEARLVEAAVEAHTRVGSGHPREAHAALLGEQTFDTRESFHFEDYGTGHRRVHLWRDRSWGAREEPDAEARAIIAVLGSGPRQVEVKPLPAAAIEPLLAFVERA